MRDVAVWVLVATALGVGSWALVAPASFAHDLGIAQAWVATDGPYNEHLVRDVGALYLGLGVLTIGLARRGERDLDRLLGSAWLVAGVPHLAYHATHLGPFEPLDAVAQMVGLLMVAVAALLLFVGDRGATRDGQRRERLVHR